MQILVFGLYAVSAIYAAVLLPELHRLWLQLVDYETVRNLIHLTSILVDCVAIYMATKCTDFTMVLFVWILSEHISNICISHTVYNIHNLFDFRNYVLIIGSFLTSATCLSIMLMPAYQQSCYGFFYGSVSVIAYRLMRFLCISKYAKEQETTCV